MSYIWQQKNWPNFQYQIDVVESQLLGYVEKSGRISGLLEGLSPKARTETTIDMMVSEAIKTSEIEGEYLSRKDVMSSIRLNLGLSTSSTNIPDKRAQGVAELMIDVRESYAEPLSEDMLFRWHKMLMGSESKTIVGGWRTHVEPMQVVSGPVGRQKVHYEAPPSESVPKEMSHFVDWFNAQCSDGNQTIVQSVINAAIAHVYFETVHPFEDGNGRIGRAIAEKVLSLGAGRPILLSLSKVIEANRNDYYEALQKAQRNYELNMTPWLVYFTGVCLQAQASAETQISFTLKKTCFFDRYGNLLNDRQLKALNRMLEEGPSGFEGGMNVRKYIGITKTSKATATRDLQDLVERGAMCNEGRGRGTRYILLLD